MGIAGVPKDDIDCWCTGGSQWELLVYRRMTVGIAGVPEYGIEIAGVPKDDIDCWCTGEWQ